MFLSDLPAAIQAWIPTAPSVTPNAVSVMAKRYFDKTDDQQVLEDVDGMYWRTAGVIAEAERTWGGNSMVVEAMRTQFFKVLRGRQFLPNSPTLANAGIRTGQFSACFVLPVPDDLEGIFDTVKNAALIHQTGGGCISGNARVWSNTGGLEAIADLVNRAKSGIAGVSEKNGTSYDVSHLGIFTSSFDPKTGQNGLKQVSKVWTFDVPGAQQVVVKTVEGTTIQTSEWHPFMVVRGTDVVEVRADDLQATDVVFGPQRPDAYWPVSDYLTLSTGEVLDEDLAWLVGCILGNGSFGASINGDRLRVFSGHQDTLVKAQRILLDLGTAVSLQKDTRSECWSVTTTTQHIVSLLKEACAITQNGVKENDIRVPRAISRSPLSVVRAFLAGLMDSDGHVETDGSPHYSTVSHDLARDVSSLVGLLGFMPTVRARAPQGNSVQVCYDVLLCPLPQVNQLAADIGLYMACALRRDRMHSTATKQTSLALDFRAWQAVLAEHALVRARGSKQAVTVDLSRELSQWSSHGRVNRASLRTCAGALTERDAARGQLLGRLADGGQEIASVTRAAVAEPYYDLTVEGWNTYAAGECGMAMIHNTGFSFSRLRPKNDIVHSSKGSSSGPVSFMMVYNAATEAIKQGGVRRGANMAMLSVDSPDILEFIDLKSDTTVCTNFNVSVAVTDAFIAAAEDEDDRYEMVNPRTGGTGEFLHAREVWQRIATRAHATGEPGLAFIDRMNQDNPVPMLGAYEATNPCGEQPLIPYESCNLGSLTLDQFVVAGAVDWVALKDATHLATRFMDNVVEANAYVPKVPKIREIAMQTRKLGLGIMGLARALFKLGLAYDSAEGREMAAALYAFIDAESKRASIELAHARGAYPYFNEHRDASVAFHRGLWDKRVAFVLDYAAREGCSSDMADIWAHIRNTYVQCLHAVGEYGIRNSTTTTIAPTGTLSVFHDTTGGCEPLFGLVFSRNQAGLQMLDGDAAFTAWLANLADLNDEQRTAILAAVGAHSGSFLQALTDDAFTVLTSAELTYGSKVFVTAGDVTPRDHILMQAALQAFNDSATSKTINMPTSATVQDVLDAYTLALTTGCKGITVYRDGSRNFQPLTTGTKSSKQLADEKMIDQTIQTNDNEGQLASNDAARDHVEVPFMATSTIGPRPRPEDLFGFTRTIDTGNGKLLTTLNYDEQGLREVLLTIGRSGGTIHSLAEAIGRLASLALQHGAPQDAVAATLIGIRSADPTGMGATKVLSIPDGLGKALQSAPRQFGHFTLPVKHQLESIVPAAVAPAAVVAYATCAATQQAVNVYGESPECKDCGASMKFEEGCSKCTDPGCGYSKCG